MKAVILAGGFGTRFSEESYLKPKPMIEIGGMPILWHIMKHYSAYGINEFIGVRSINGWNWDFSSGFPIASIDTPVDTIMFADAAVPCRHDGMWANISNMDFLSYSSSVYAAGYGYTPSMHFRHNQKANAVFCDGHAESMDMVSSSSGFEKEFLGFPCSDDEEGMNKYFHPRQ